MAAGFQDVQGLSPRGRGNPNAADALPLPGGSIPAWAGEPIGYQAQRDQRMVYPRVGGGTSLRPTCGSSAQGLSPRGRGNLRHGPTLPPEQGSIPAWAGEPDKQGTHPDYATVYPRVGGGTPGQFLGPVHLLGLSPRGRGNPSQLDLRMAYPRSIPAWAGEPPKPKPLRRRRGVYPRVGGGTALVLPQLPPAQGLSPRGRGNPPRASSSPSRCRSIPAWAGEPERVDLMTTSTGVYPRVGGGTVNGQYAAQPLGGLSPRGRGNRRSQWAGRPQLRSIPAWAGEPPWCPSRWNMTAVYPRVGGGTLAAPGPSLSTTGLSPRGRGNQGQPAELLRVRRSIPAWAGEPPGNLSGL